MMDMTAFISPFKAMIDSFAANPMDALLKGNAGAEIGLPILIIAVLGLIECLFGLKLLRLELLVFGFGAGFFLGNMIAEIDAVAGLLTAPWMKYALMGVLGIVCTILAYKFLRLALTLGVAAAAYFFLGPILGGMLPSPLIGKIVALVLGLVLGLIAQKLLKTVVILVTVFLGSYLTAYALSGVLQNYIIRLPSMTIIAFAFFFIIGLSTQVKGIKRK